MSDSTALLAVVVLLAAAVAVLSTALARRPARPDVRDLSRAAEQNDRPAVPAPAPPAGRVFQFSAGNFPRSWKIALDDAIEFVSCMAPTEFKRSEQRAGAQMPRAILDAVSTMIEGLPGAAEAMESGRVSKVVFSKRTRAALSSGAMVLTETKGGYLAIARDVSTGQFVEIATVVHGLTAVATGAAVLRVATWICAQSDLERIDLKLSAIDGKLDEILEFQVSQAIGTVRGNNRFLVQTLQDAPNGRTAAGDARDYQTQLQAIERESLQTIEAALYRIEARCAEVSARNADGRPKPYRGDAELEGLSRDFHQMISDCALLISANIVRIRAVLAAASSLPFETANRTQAIVETVRKAENLSAAYFSHIDARVPDKAWWSRSVTLFGRELKQTVKVDDRPDRLTDNAARARNVIESVFKYHRELESALDPGPDVPVEYYLEYNRTSGEWIPIGQREANTAA